MDVHLEFDVSYRDKYKRLLASAYTSDGKSIQEELLKNGFARLFHLCPYYKAQGLV
ncbi:thermonuclease family protein [Lysinibacillus sp. NPDC097287]|uniref:thermonuclease family protein n=1 Tax=Lysinibacillus sp. NPDC097287 TaxID=3364144 RepID=UPI0038015D48